LIDFLHTSIRLSPGDDAGCVAAQRVGYNDHTSGEQAQTDLAFLSIVETVIHECDAWTGKHRFGIGEIDAVLIERG
jgi:hypothetical protein